MSFNYGNYGMTGINGMYGMFGMNNIGGGNMHQYFKNKYGCPDCFRTQPYLSEYPKPITPLPRQVMRPSFWQRFINKLAG